MRRISRFGELARVEPFGPSPRTGAACPCKTGGFRDPRDPAIRTEEITSPEPGNLRIPFAYTARAPVREVEPLGGFIQRINRTTDAAKGKRPEVVRTRSRGVHKGAAGGDRVVRAPVGDGGLDDDDGKAFGIDALTPPLSQVEGGRLAARQENPDPCVAHQRAGSHVDPAAPHGREMALGVFEFEPAVASGKKLYLQRYGLPPRLAPYREPSAIPCPGSGPR